MINGKRTTRKIGNFNELNQQQADARASEMLCSMKLQAVRNAPTVMSIIESYRADKLSKLRHSTQKANNSWLRVYIEPIWGETPITDLQARMVEMWLESLDLAPRTRGHIKELMHRLVDYAMWCGSIPLGTNPISLVTVRGSSKRQKQPRSLTVEEFHTTLRESGGNHFSKTMVLVQLCLGLRVSELLALRWKDVDWIGSKLVVEHGIVNQHLDTVKTEGSRKAMALDPQLLSVLSAWKQATEFRDAADWIFASPVKLGRLPISYTG